MALGQTEDVNKKDPFGLGVDFRERLKREGNRNCCLQSVACDENGVGASQHNGGESVRRRGKEMG
jgi:hypothetical protein